MGAIGKNGQRTFFPTFFNSVFVFCMYTLQGIKKKMSEVHCKQKCKKSYVQPTPSISAGKAGKTPVFSISSSGLYKVKSQNRATQFFSVHIHCE